MDPLVGQPYYVVTASTGVVHKVPCIRNTARKPLPWLEFHDRDDRACSHCLPNGLPAIKVKRGRVHLA